MKRVSEVLDCWFESGSVPFARLHYPFDNKEWFENHSPSDFVVEYTGQIRCWFYYLHVLSVALFDKPAYKNCVVHGTVLDEATATANGVNTFLPDMIYFGELAKEEPKTEAPAADEAPAEDNTPADGEDKPLDEGDAVTEPATAGGCASSVAAAGIALIATLGTCTAFVAKKKED